MPLPTKPKVVAKPVAKVTQSARVKSKKATVEVNEVEYNSVFNGNLFTTDYFEYEENSSSCNIKVAGRLNDHVQFWRSINANQFVIDIIEKGYAIPFYQTPPRSPIISRNTVNNMSAYRNEEFVSSAISELLESGCVVHCPEQPYIVNPLSVSTQRSGKKRLILDLSVTNKFLWKQSVKYEDLRTALVFLKRQGFMFQFDLKSGYHHISILPDHQKYLGFSWEFEGKLSFFKFTVLPFGLSSAPYVFTKVVRPLVKKWRSEGKDIVVFLDDGLGYADSFQKANQHSAEVKSDLINAGFVPNVQKSIWNPVSETEWLGFVINLKDGLLILPERRISSIKESIRHILNSATQSGRLAMIDVRALASATGKIISAYLSVGSMSRIMTKAMHTDIETRLSWNSKVVLSWRAQEELHFWLNNIDHISSTPINFVPSCSKIIYSDASSKGFGGYLVDTDDHVSHGQWSADERKFSSSWRELKAVELVLKSHVSKLQHARVKWFTDNQAVARIVDQGSMKQDLHVIALDICRFCVRNGIFLEMEWIPRSLNDKADFISKIVDPDDWQISDDIFASLDNVWGPHSVDRFASFYNAKLPRFNSRFWNPGSEAIDAFTEDWSQDNNWLVPPIHLIPRVILFLLRCRSEGTLVCPAWQSAPYWPLLFPDGITPRQEISEIIEFCHPFPLVKEGRGPNSKFAETIVHSAILAIRFQKC